MLTVAADSYTISLAIGWGTAADNGVAVRSADRDERTAPTPFPAEHYLTKVR